jgi:hypothetical protein
MSPARSTARALRCALLIAAALLPAGCAEELGPVPMPVARVHGVLTEGHRAISGGWIEFIPVDGTVGNLRSARLEPDGSFDADGVAVGVNAIRLVDAPIESPAHGRLFSTYASPIRRAISADPSQTFHIDLVEEAIRAREKRSRGPAGTSATTGEGP